MSPSPVVRVLYAALASRLLLLLLALVSDSRLADYDTSWRYDVPNTSTRCELSDGDEKFPQKHEALKAFCHVVQDSLAWDSLHYLRVSQCGYETEKSHAFFPMLPALMRGVQATLLRSALPVLYPRCTLALAGLLVSNTSFVLAALALYWLGCLTLRDGDLALRAAYLFCFNPASVFFSGIYTEAVFAFISWAGALSLVVDSPWRAALAFSTAAATRSNGVLCCLLLLWDSGRRISRLPRRPRDAAMDRRAALLELLGVTLRCLLVCTPALLFQVWAYLRFCVHVGDGARPWCAWTVPSVYTFVQQHYWNLGMFKYYEAKQLPNFLLAAPILALTLAGVRTYIRADPARWVTLGIFPLGAAPGDASQRHRRLARPDDSQRLLKPLELAQLEREEPSRAERQRRQVESGELVPFGFPERPEGVAPPALPLAHVPSAAERTTAPSSSLRHRRTGGIDGAAVAGASADSAATEAVDAGSPDASDPDDDAIMQQLGPDPDVVPAVVVTHLSADTAAASMAPGGLAPEFGFLSTQVLPHVLLLALLALPAVLVMHIQVATRLLCTSPATFWYAAHVTGTRPRLGRLIWLWFLGYAAVGTVLHVNFYPWT